MGSIAAMQAAARRIEDTNPGYNQARRWSFFDRSSLTLYSNKACDCSSVCGAIARLGGYDVDLWGTFYTGNFRARLVAAGFSAIRFHSLSQLQPGDFVLNEGLHVEFVSDWGQMYSASIDENGNISGGKDGDQTGSEVRYRSAYVYYAGWEWILRPPAGSGGGAGASSGSSGGDMQISEMYAWRDKNGRNVVDQGIHTHTVLGQVLSEVRGLKGALFGNLKVARDGKQISALQELADVKTIAIRQEATVKALEQTVRTLASMQGVDPATIEKTVKQTVEKALANVELTLKAGK